MYLFARWKDFSVTATVANWEELTEFADGSTSAGNGTGSVKVGCWYRDWQPGDADPTIDFSSSPDNASVVITVMQKDADDVWLTPVARTAAMTNWTTTSQIVSASATAAVPSGGVVMGLIGIRDDTATMTRPTTGIDDSTGAVTWNGNYVESPATHHSTTTGFDGAADLGCRLVSIGATATLRMTGTISAAETGAALWVIQGTTIVVTPAPASLGFTTFTPTLRLGVTPATVALEVTTFTPSLRSSVVPSRASFAITSLAPTLYVSITPARANLTISTFSPSLASAVTPATRSLTIISFAPTLSGAVTPATFNLVLTAFAPSLWPPNLVFIDPGGDAVQVVGYLNSLIGGTVTFDTAQKVVGVGSWKFDSGAGNDASRVSVNGVLGANRRGSFYFRYDSVPDTAIIVTDFTDTAAIYSGGGLTDTANLQGDEGIYATATPAKNDGQGSALGFSSLGGDLPLGAVIDSVKIIYKRKYDTADSIGISRVKYRIDGVEGPNHDNTDEPTTDTVVEVDVTDDRHWERQDLLSDVFEVIAEARRGDTDTEHTQSWDFLKVEVVYHTAVQIWEARDSTNAQMFTLAVLPFGDGVCIRFIDGAANSYDGITELAINTQHRIGYAFTNPDGVADDLHIKIYINSIPELDISEASTGGFVEPVNMRHGWCNPPGASKSCWIDQVYMDDGDDLTDVGNILSTAKLPATVNNDNFDTTGGTGAVNERPVDLANFRQQAATAQVDQDYTIQTASVGDVDLTGKTLVGHMGWLVAKKSGFAGTFGFILDGSVTTLLLTTTAALVKRAVTSTSYPSNAAGIGLRSATASNDAFLLEGGIVIGYQGPTSPSLLLERQQVDNETLDTVVDDLRADPPDSYEVCCQYDDFDGTVEIVIHSLDQDGGSLQFQGALNSNGRVRITPGVEVRLDATVTGVTNLQIWRRINVD